jgi:hypothetical protein
MFVARYLLSFVLSLSLSLSLSLQVLANTVGSLTAASLKTRYGVQKSE